MISILCPSRGRPELAKRMRDSILSTKSGDVELLFGLDYDDTTRGKYEGDVFVTTKQEGVGTIWNSLYRQCHGDIIMMGNDDLVWKTEGWDVKILEQVQKYSDGIYVAYCDDGINHERHCAFPIVSRKWIETLGYFVPECFNFLYHDTWLYDIGKKLDRMVYMQDIIVEHMHFTAGKSQYDETYRRHREGVTDKRAEDGFMFQKTEWFRNQDIKKLREVTK